VPDPSTSRNETPTCRSGRHTWTDSEDAKRCCNGWRRQLVVARPALGEALPPDVRSVGTLPGALCGFVWVPASEVRPNER
jgi:hypothetical protein